MNKKKYKNRRILSIFNGAILVIGMIIATISYYINDNKLMFFSILFIFIYLPLNDIRINLMIKSLLNNDSNLNDSIGMLIKIIEKQREEK